MKKASLGLLALLTFALLGTAVAATRNMQKSMKTPAAQKTLTAMKNMGQQLAPMENLSGTLKTVIPTKNLVVVKDAKGVPFDFRISHSTRIVVNGKKGTLAALKSNLNQPISVKFLPLTSGDLARSVRISS